MQKIIAKVDHDKLLPFLKGQLKLKSGWGFVYWLFNILCLSFTLYYCISINASLDTIISGLGLGFACFVLLLPIHEVIHGIAYKIVGAPKVSYGADWRKGIAYAVADKFIVGFDKFLIVALSPFVIINAIMVIIFLLIPSNYSLVLLGALILHTAGCFGDFALISFMQKHRSVNILTMDNLEEKATYFYEGKKDGNGFNS